MAEKFNYKRVIFPDGKQGRFIEKVLVKIPLQKAMSLCGLSARTIRDWRREKFSMDYKSLKILCRHIKLSIPHNIKLQDRYWCVVKGASKGGEAIMQKYGRVGGDPEYRKMKWREWWEREGKYKKYSVVGTSKPIKTPSFSEDLAEFVGIILGDGGISRYQMVITLHMIDDKEYGNFICNLAKELFGVPVGIHSDKKNSVIDYVISRIELIRLLKKLGLKEGNKVKQQVDIPDWIKKNKKYSIACVRGLVDTDGCIFTHRYKVKHKIYSYKKLSFTSRSGPLRLSVFRILNSLDIKSRLDNDYDVMIDAQQDTSKYFRVIGSHNPKHLKRYKD